MTKPLLTLTRLCTIPLLTALLWSSGQNGAHAKLMICNETGESRNVAIGYKDNGEWVSEGWWNVGTQKCVTPIKEDLQKSFYYYRATSKGGDFDGQDFIFCSTGKAYTIRGDKDCKKRGYDRADFRELKLAKGTLGFRLTLNDKTIYEDGKKPAKEPAKKASPALSAKTDQPAKPGAYGKPYEIGAIYRGCPKLNGVRRCLFEAQGTRYLVVEDQRADKRILQRLKGMKNGESYVFVGDIVSQTDASAEVTIRAMESREATENELLMNRLAGKWRALDDPNVVVIFGSDFTKQENYGSDTGGHELIEFTETCKDPQVRPSDEKLLQVFGPSDPDNVFCYAIVENTYDRLTLMYLPRGNFLEYKREQR